MKFVVVFLIMALFVLLALCQETGAKDKDIDSYQKALMEEVVLGKYADARREYIRIGETTEDKHLKWLCRFRAALCAEKLGNFVEAKEEFGKIADEASLERLVDAAKMGILRVDAHLKRQSRMLEILRERIEAYRALEAELKKNDGKRNAESVRSSRVGEFVAHYFGILTFQKGVDAFRRMEFETAARRFREALRWLPNFGGASEFLRRCEFIIGSGKAVTGEPPKPEDSLLEYLSSVSVKSSPAEDAAVVLLNRREVLRWLPEDAVSRRVSLLCDDVERRFWEEAAKVSGSKMVEVERLDGEASVIVRRLKRILLKGAETKKREGVVDTTVVFWLRVLLLEKGLNDTGAVDVGKVKSASGRSSFTHGTVDISALKRANPRVLVAVRWRLNDERQRAQTAVKGLVGADGLVLSTLSVEGEKMSGSSVRVRLKLVWKKGERVFNEVVEHAMTPIYGFAELFGGWRLGKRYLFCSVEWGEK